jgi:hypothetical protein
MVPKMKLHGALWKDPGHTYVTRSCRYRYWKAFVGRKLVNSPKYVHSFTPNSSTSTSGTDRGDWD